MLSFLNIAQLVLYIALLALVGQGVLYVLAGAKRDRNIFYQLLQIVSKPFTLLVRKLTPRQGGRPARAAGHLLPAADRLRRRHLREDLRCVSRRAWRVAGEAPGLPVAEGAGHGLAAAGPQRPGDGRVRADGAALPAEPPTRGPAARTCTPRPDATRRRWKTSMPCCSLQPEDARTWFNKGFVLEQLERWDEALAAFRRATELQPQARPRLVRPGPGADPPATLRRGHRRPQAQHRTAAHESATAGISWRGFMSTGSSPTRR